MRKCFGEPTTWPTDPNSLADCFGGPGDAESPERTQPGRLRRQQRTGRACAPGAGGWLRLGITATARLLLLLMLPAAVQAQYGYMINNGDITITSYDCSGGGGAVAIPGTINGLPVTRIGGAAFWDCTNLTSVTIPNSVTDIENEAFAGCTSLTSVAIPDSVTNIGDLAFSRCYSLTNVTIGNGVTIIGRSAFASCTSLTNVTIPKSVTFIEPYTFGGCSSLTSVTIPNSVMVIGWYAFAYCTNLTSIMIPDSVTNIWGRAFQGCTSLSAITVEALNLTYSSVDGVLFDKSQTTLIQYPCGKAGSFTIPNSVTNVGALAFLGCTRLTKVTIPNNVASIKEFAFSDCTNLTGVYFQGNTPSVDPSVFADANIVTVYYLPGTTGWGATFAGRPTALWSLPYPVILSGGTGFGVAANGFGFTISWATNASVVVEASADLATPVWTPVGTNTLTGGSSYFSDPQWSNQPRRFYRLRSP